MSGFVRARCGELISGGSAVGSVGVSGSRGHSVTPAAPRSGVRTALTSAPTTTPTCGRTNASFPRQGLEHGLEVRCASPYSVALGSSWTILCTMYTARAQLYRK